MPATKRKSVAKRAAPKPARKAVAKKTTPPTKPPAAKRRSVVGMTAMDKAKEFAQFARDNEWWAGIKSDKDSGAVIVTVKRDDGRYKEMITVEWQGNRVIRNGILYTIDGTGRTLVVHNVSAARHHIDGSRLLKREVKVRRKRRAASKAKLRVMEDGTIAYVVEDEQEKEVVLHYHRWYDMVVYTESKIRGKVKQKVLMRTGNIGTPQIESLTRIFKADHPDAIIATREAEASVKSRAARGDLS